MIARIVRQLSFAAATIALVVCATSAYSQVQVTSATPSAAAQGTINLNVTVGGSGFKKGANAKWFVTGTTNPGGVTVNSTAFNNNSQLTANITVAADATIANFDIVVANTDGRIGKGTELFAVTTSGSGQKLSNLSITTTFASTDASDAIADIQSDTMGSYLDGVGGVTSFLTTNGYNGIVWGDWQFGTLNSTTRMVSISFAAPIQVANGGTATPNPPFTIKDVSAHIEDECTLVGKDMITMQKTSTLQCGLIVHFFDSTGAEYRIYMVPIWTDPATPETTYEQVTCNAVASDGGCNDWYVDPIPAVDGNGNPIPGAAIGRLVYFPKHGSTNEGDYYFRFHFHLTRP